MWLPYRTHTERNLRKRYCRSAHCWCAYRNNGIFYLFVFRQFQEAPNKIAHSRVSPFSVFKIKYIDLTVCGGRFASHVFFFIRSERDPKNNLLLRLVECIRRIFAAGAELSNPEKSTHRFCPPGRHAAFTWSAKVFAILFFLVYFFFAYFIILRNVRFFHNWIFILINFPNCTKFNNEPVLQITNQWFILFNLKWDKENV